LTHAPEYCFSGACDSSKELTCNPIKAAPKWAQLSLFKTEVNMKGEHVRRDNIKALLTARLTIELNHGQYFCETVKAYEIWESRNGLEYRVKRISKKSVLWVAEK
jgi:hypothetical protein